MLSYLVNLTSRLMVMGGLRDEEGQGLAEYALILAFIAVVAILALTFLGTTISSLLSNVANEL
jgi:pilus assembly protein Flp/PilA